MTDFEVVASRALKPYYLRAPSPGNMTPYAYQHAAVEYALRRNNCLIGDAPGVGKTAEAILLSNALQAEWNLVICPASLVLNWEREVWHWSTIRPWVQTYPVKKSKDGVSNTHNYVIMSYDMLRNAGIFNAIMSETWDHLILDEAHYLKDPKGNLRTKPICGHVTSGGVVHDGIVDRVGRVSMLSGTILPNQPVECYNAIRLLDHSAINYASLADFNAMYYDYGEGFVTRRRWNLATNQFEVKREWSDNVRNVPTNLADLQYRLRSKIMVRRLKEDVLPQLPPKQWHPFPLVTDPKMRKAAANPAWKLAEQLYEMDPGAFNTAIPVDGSVSTARREMGEAKAPAIASYIEDLLREGVEKVVVATWHNSVIDYLTAKLAKHGLVSMTGGMSTIKKQAMVDQFQMNPEVRIIIGQMKVLGLGWTLTAAQDVVFAEFDYVPGNNDQFLDRIHRQGQKGDYVLGHVPLVPGTLEEKIMGSSIGKAQTIYHSLDA